MIASQTHDVAVQTDTIAKLVVSNADAKEFDGKDTVQAKTMQNHQTPAPTQKIDLKEKKSPNPKPTSPKVSNKITPIKSSHSSDDKWASF